MNVEQRGLRLFWLTWESGTNAFVQKSAIDKAEIITKCGCKFRKLLFKTQDNLSHMLRSNQLSDMFIKNDYAIYKKGPPGPQVIQFVTKLLWPTVFGLVTIFHGPLKGPQWCRKSCQVFLPGKRTFGMWEISPFWRRKNIYPSPWIQWIQSLADRSRPRGRLLRLIDLMYPSILFLEGEQKPQPFFGSSDGFKNAVWKWKNCNTWLSEHEFLSLEIRHSTCPSKRPHWLHSPGFWWIRLGCQTSAAASMAMIAWATLWEKDW